MFTGIVEEIGTVKEIKRGKASALLTIEAHQILEDMKIGDSIAVNGVCLTAATFTSSSFTADVMHETLDRSNLGTLNRGSSVNLERAMKADGRFGGHIVSGHIDGSGIITNIRQDDNAVWYTIQAPSQIMRYIIEKGSIAIDGISLTVADLTQETFSVSIIPHTRAQTILSLRKSGDAVNLENDCIGKYVEKLLTNHQESESSTSSNITQEFLTKYDF